MITEQERRIICKTIASLIETFESQREQVDNDIGFKILKDESPTDVTLTYLNSTLEFVRDAPGNPLSPLARINNEDGS